MRAADARGSLRPFGRRRPRGQALVVAVLILILVAAVAAIFLAVVAGNLAFSTRQVELTEAAFIADAGVKYADQQLVYDPEGADWRPDPAEQFPVGNGFFTLTVDYNPARDPSNPLAKFIVIRATGRIRGNPFVSRTLIAYKPLLLPDYLWYIANTDGSAAPANLGIPTGPKNLRGGEVELMALQTSLDMYTNVVDGPIFSNRDLRWVGLNEVRLSPARGDRVAVAGRMELDRLAAPDAFVELRTAPSTFPGDGIGRASDDPLFSTLTGLWRDGLLTIAPGDRRPRWVRPLAPPRIDLLGPNDPRSRYTKAARDSGLWCVRNDTGTWVNTGWFGTLPLDSVTMLPLVFAEAQGLYVDNETDIQFSHDVEALRAEVMAGPSVGAWGTGDIYDPPGVDIRLRETEIELIRRDGRSWIQPIVNLATQPPTCDLVAVGNVLRRPYPLNGVLFAQGNLRVAGQVPANTPLNLVSGGTIYIHGSLLGRPTAKVALLARDSVVLNMSAIPQVLPVDQDSDSFDGRPPFHWRITVDKPLRASFLTPRPDPVAGPQQQIRAQVVLSLRHTGFVPPLGSPGPTRIQLVINGQLFDWNGAGTTYQVSEVWPRWESAVFDVTDWVNPPGQENAIEFMLAPDAANEYLISALLTGDVQIEGVAAYAQTGSWIIVPLPPEKRVELQRAGMWPPDTRIAFRGALAMNRTPPTGDVTRWTADWRGAIAWLDAFDNTERFGPFYRYDATLVGVRAPGLPSIPRLPVGTGLVALGERI